MCFEFARLIQDVLPAGVFNVITGSSSGVGNSVLKHKGFQKTGIYRFYRGRQRCRTGVGRETDSVTLELGGKSANIFFDDCKWDMALDGLQLGILFNQGQVCCAGSKVFVKKGIYDKFVEAAVKAFNHVKVGLPWEQDTQMGSTD